MKKILFLFIFLFLFTGCVSYTELNELGIINAIALSKENEEIILTASLLSPKKEEGESTYDIRFLESKGKTIDEAFQNLYLESNKKIFLSHLQLLVVDEAMAQNHLKELLSFFLENETSRNNFPIVLAKEAPPQELLQTDEASPSVEDLLLVNQTTRSESFLLTLEDLARLILEEDSSVIPVVGFNQNPIILGLAYVKGQKVEYLSLEESNAYLFLTNKIQKMNFTLEDEKITVDENNTLVTASKNQIHITFQTTLFFDGDKEKGKTLFEEEVRKRIDSLFQKLKEEDIDLLHFTTLVYRNDYPYYKTHSENLFHHLSYEITFQTKVENASLKQEGGNYESR